MKETLFTERMKLADLILANPNLLLMLSRFNIPFGFGNKKVVDVCKQYGISPDFFILICNVYSFNNYLPSNEQIVATDMRLMAKYLEASHRFYLDKRLPHIGQHLRHIADGMNPKVASVLTHFFSEYCDEVTVHFSYEEKVVFPYIESLIDNTANTSFHIEEFTKAHTNIEDKLDDLTQIVFKYLPESIIPDEAISVVFDILKLSEDIKKHSLIEEKILVPYAEYLENQKK